MNAYFCYIFNDFVRQLYKTIIFAKKRIYGTEKSTAYICNSILHHHYRCNDDVVCGTWILYQGKCSR